MSKTIQMILGSAKFLADYQQHAKVPLLMLAPLVAGHNSALLDMQGRARFQAPLRFNVLAAAGDFAPYGFLEFSYFRLNDEEAPVFVDATKHVLAAQAHLATNLSLQLLTTANKQREYVLLSQWAKPNAGVAAMAMPVLAPITAFVKRAVDAGGYHAASYRIVKPQAKD